MDRFQILKDIEPPPLTAKERLEAEALKIFQDTVDKKYIQNLIEQEKRTQFVNGLFYPNSEATDTSNE
jgi:hypothetical protein